MLLTNRVLAVLLLLSVCLNFGMFQSFMNRPDSGEKILSVNQDGKQVLLTVGDGQGYPTTLLMNSDQARALARSVDSKADELDRLPTVAKTVKATNDELEQGENDKGARAREAEIQEKMRRVPSENPFESY